MGKKRGEKKAAAVAAWLEKRGLEAVPREQLEQLKTAQRDTWETLEICRAQLEAAKAGLERLKTEWDLGREEIVFSDPKQLSPAQARRVTRTMDAHRLAAEQAEPEAATESKTAQIQRLGDALIAVENVLDGRGYGRPGQLPGRVAKLALENLDLKRHMDNLGRLVQAVTEIGSQTFASDRCPGCYAMVRIAKEATRAVLQRASVLRAEAALRTQPPRNTGPEWTAFENELERRLVAARQVIRDECMKDGQQRLSHERAGRVTAEGLTEREKNRRIYYQQMVYAVCNALDAISGSRPGQGVVCGTFQYPNGDVAAMMKVIVPVMKAAPRTDDGVPYVPNGQEPFFCAWCYEPGEAWQISPCHTPSDPDEHATGLAWIVESAVDEVLILGVYSTEQAAETAAEQEKKDHEQT